MSRLGERGPGGEILAAALQYAAHGWAVFPVHGIVGRRCSCGASECSSPGKHPLTRRGVKDASSDARIISGWWRSWPGANVALATGSASGVVVIDVDPPHGDISLDRLTDAGYELPQTLAVRTGSGGLHLYYATPDFALGNSAGRLAGISLELPGVDLRADGGYVVAPPSVHVSGLRYAWIADEAELSPAPAWLTPAEHIPVTEPAAIEVEAQGSTTAYGRAALAGELEELGRAPVGTRNHTLNRCAFRLGRLIAGGELSGAEIVAALRARAIGRGLSPREVERTIASGLAAGRKTSSSPAPLLNKRGSRSSLS
jgi:Bifunctional DNA primase/polymerase, N-terminal